MPSPAPTRYRLDIAYLPLLLLPPLLRRPRLLAWLEALLEPLRQHYADFVAYQAATFRELTYNGQTIVLEGALNDQFDPDLRRIRIDNSDVELEPLYFNLLSEQQPAKYVRLVAESPPWLYAYAYSEFASQTDFTVRVPASLRTGQRSNQLHARIRRFKPAMRHYQLLFNL